jgi:predicted nucleic acid-binding protein
MFALVDEGQEAHLRCKDALPAMSKPLITTWPRFAEAMYLAGRAGKWPRQRALWKLVTDGLVTFHHPSTAEIARMHILMEKYHDMPMDLADASLVAAAETLGLKRVFTIDSDFYVYRINGREAFEVVP